MIPAIPAMKRCKKNGTNGMKDSKVDVGKALDLRINKGLSYEDIGKYFGVSKQNIHQCLTRFNHLLGDVDKTDIDAYRTNRVSIFNAAEMRLLHFLLDVDKLQKASANNMAYAFTQLHTARRLEEGKSTSNVNIAEITASISELEEKEKVLEAELAKYDRPTAT